MFGLQSLGWLVLVLVLLPPRSVARLVGPKKFSHFSQLYLIRAHVLACKLFLPFRLSSPTHPGCSDEIIIQRDILCFVYTFYWIVTHLAGVTLLRAARLPLGSRCKLATLVEPIDDWAINSETCPPSARAHRFHFVLFNITPLSHNLFMRSVIFVQRSRGKRQFLLSSHSRPVGPSGRPALQAMSSASDSRLLIDRRWQVSGFKL